MSDKPRIFWFHYNKPASQAAGRTKWSLHTGRKCLIVDGIDCRVPVMSRNRTRQPKAVLFGRGTVEVSKFLGRDEAEIT